MSDFHLESNMSDFTDDALVGKVDQS